MKWLNRLSALLFGLLSIGVIRNFLSKYEVLVFDKEDLAEIDQQQSGLDLRGTPTHVCTCGSRVWYVKSIFDDYEIATYFLDMICAECGNYATAPTPLDREGMEP
jgi:hypothetical protein